jgi:hypothetical protein
MHKLFSEKKKNNKSNTRSSKLLTDMAYLQVLLAYANVIISNFAYILLNWFIWFYNCHLKNIHKSDPCHIRHCLAGGFYTQVYLIWNALWRKFKLMWNNTSLYYLIEMVTLNEKPDHWKVINIVIQCIYWYWCGDGMVFFSEKSLCIFLLDKISFI